MIDPFHWYQLIFGDFQMYQLHITTIPLKFEIHQSDQTMSMVIEIQWI